MSEKKADWAGFVAIQNLESKQYLLGATFYYDEKEHEHFAGTFDDNLRAVFSIDYALELAEEFKKHGIDCGFVVDDEGEEEE